MRKTLEQYLATKTLPSLYKSLRYYQKQVECYESYYGPMGKDTGIWYATRIHFIEEEIKKRENFKNPPAGGEPSGLSVGQQTHPRYTEWRKQMLDVTKQFPLILGIFILWIISTENPFPNAVLLEPITLGAGIAMGAASLLGAGGQAVATGKMNKKSRFHSLRMYERQLADNIALWNMQNEYNSPTSQMSRLKEAGLNPNLIYGGGGAAASGNADSIHQGRMSEWNPETPNVGGIGQAIGDSIKNFYSIRQMDLAAERERKNITIANQKINDNTLDVGLKLVKLNTGRQDLHQKERLSNIMYDMAAQQLQKTSLETAYSVNEEERKKIAASQTTRQALLNIKLGEKALAKSDKEIAYIDQQIKNIEQDTALKQFDVQNTRAGISPDADYIAKYLATKAPKMTPYYIGAQAGSDLLGDITKILGNTANAARAIQGTKYLKKIQKR